MPVVAVAAPYAKPEGQAGRASFGFYARRTGKNSENAVLRNVEIERRNWAAMTPIDYIRIDAEILQLDISDKGKFLLGLVKRFKHGLRMSNSDLAELLKCSPDNIPRILREVNEYVRIENPQSRYRTMFYSGANDGVDSRLLRQINQSKNDSTPTFEHATPTFEHATPAQTPDIIESNISNTYISQFEQSRKIYPGTKRGSKTEYENFKKKHRDWKEVLPLLQPAIERQTKTIWANTEKKYIPHFQTWVNKRRWELECTTETTVPFDPDAAAQRKKMLENIA